MTKSAGGWPDRWLVIRRGNGDDRTVFAGYISSARPDGKGNIQVVATGPEGLLQARQLGFSPPFIEAALEHSTFEFWWRLLDYVFGLADPRAFGSLPSSLLTDEEREVLTRFASTTKDLAASSILNALGGGLFVRLEDQSDVEHVTADFGAKDAQLGFTGLLRQCDSPQESASFKRACDTLWKATGRLGEPADRESRQQALVQWRRAIGHAHAKSIDQLLRDKLVSEEGMGVLEFDEPDSPQFLLSAFSYGDLIHWGEKRPVLAAWDKDEFLSAERRSAFLAAAAGLAHLYIGFGQLAHSALGDVQPGAAKRS